MKDTLDLIARIFLGLLFLYEAFDTLVFFKETKVTLSSYNITWGQDVILVGMIALLLIGGTLVLIGYYARVGAFLLLLYWIPFTFIVYSFWNDPTDLMRMSIMNFMKNLALAAGLLLLVVNGSGKFSVNRVIHVLRLPE